MVALDGREQQLLVVLVRDVLDHQRGAPVLPRLELRQVRRHGAPKLLQFPRELRLVCIALLCRLLSRRYCGAWRLLLLLPLLPLLLLLACCCSAAFARRARQD